MIYHHKYVKNSDNRAHNEDFKMDLVIEKKDLLQFKHQYFRLSEDFITQIFKADITKNMTVDDLGLNYYERH